MSSADEEQSSLGPVPTRVSTGRSHSGPRSESGAKDDKTVSKMPHKFSKQHTESEIKGKDQDLTFSDGEEESKVIS